MERNLEFTLIFLIKCDTCQEGEFEWRVSGEQQQCMSQSSWKDSILKKNRYNLVVRQENQWLFFWNKSSLGLLHVVARYWDIQYYSYHLLYWLWAKVILSVTMLNTRCGEFCCIICEGLSIWRSYYAIFIFSISKTGGKLNWKYSSLSFFERCFIVYSHSKGRTNFISFWRLSYVMVYKTLN